MPSPLCHLNDPKSPHESLRSLNAMLDRSFFDTLNNRFGMAGEYEEASHQLAKVLLRYQSAAKNAAIPQTSPQTKELERLKNAADRALAAFSKVSEDNRVEIDEAILYRDPFNRRFFFKKQLDYWKKNENSVRTAITKLTQVSHAIDVVFSNRKSEADVPKRTINTPLDHLIEDLTTDFERDTNKEAHQYCYYDPQSSSYVGQFFDFVKFILDHFAPRSYHSEVALGKRIVRVLAKSGR